MINKVLVTDDEPEKSDAENAKQRALEEPSVSSTIREQEERLRDLVDPPHLRTIREQEERFRDLVDPSHLRTIREQEERLRDLVDPPYLRTIREQEERLRDLFDPPHLRTIREQEERLRDLFDPPHLRTIREQQERLLELVDPPALRSAWGQEVRLRELVCASEHAVRSLEPATAFARSAEFFGLGANVIESALRFARLYNRADTTALAAAGISKLVTQISMPTFESVGGLLNVGVDFFESPVEDAPACLVAELSPEVFRALDLDTALRINVSKIATDERGALALRTSDELETAVAAFDPELVALLTGARQAVLSDNPDKTRHMCISLRELLGHALRQLAPDSAITSWTKDPIHFHDGRPTRKARLEYLYRGIPQPLRSLIDADIRTALELFDVLSKGSHVANLEASATAQLLLMTRAEGILLLLLRLEAHGSTCV